jgi:hypothetical protein
MFCFQWNLEKPFHTKKMEECEDMAKGVISKFWDRRYMLDRPEMCSVSTEIVTSTEKSATVL